MKELNFPEKIGYLGNYKTVIPIALAFAYYLYTKGKKEMAERFLLMISLTFPLQFIPKEIIKKPRPTPRKTLQKYSMPSGHTINSFTLFGGMYLYHTVLIQEDGNFPDFLMAFALPSIISINQVERGVHDFEDIIIGFGISLWLLIFFYKIEKSLQ